MPDTGFVFDTRPNNILYVESFTWPSTFRARIGQFRRVMLVDHCVEEVEIDGQWTPYQHDIMNCSVCELNGGFISGERSE